MTDGGASEDNYQQFRKVPVAVFVAVTAAVIVVVPGAVLHRLGLSGTIGLTGVAAMTATAMLGWRAGVLSAAALSFGLVVADVSAHFWLTATMVMVVVSVAYGLSAMKGWQWGLMLTTVQFAVIIVNPPTRDLTLTHPLSVLDLFLVTAGTTVFAVVAVSLVTRGRALSVETPVPADRVVAYVVMLGLAAAITTPIATVGHLKGGPALLMTPMIVLEPYLRHGMMGRLLDRGWGVFLGSLLGIGAAVALNASWAIYGAGALAAALAICAKLAKWEYRRYVEALTATIVLFSGSRAAIVASGRERMVATLLGLSISATLAALAIPFLRRAQRNDMAHPPTPASS